MRRIWTITELSGINQAQSNGAFVEDYNRQFVTKGVVVGISILYNETTGLNTLVTNATETRIDATGLSFKRGDFYRVTLNVPWTMKTADGELIEVECNRCGFSYPSKDLVKGLCSVCIDKPQRS